MYEEYETIEEAEIDNSEGERAGGVISRSNANNFNSRKSLPSLALPLTRIAAVPIAELFCSE